MVDINTAVRFVDDVLDGNPKTNDFCPGKIDGKKLVKIAVQHERRLLVFKRIKHIIYVQEGTREIWYKNNECYPSAVKMGFSISQMGNDKRAVPMEVYAELLIDGRSRPDTLVISVGDSARNWLARNDFELV